MTDTFQPSQDPYGAITSSTQDRTLRAGRYGIQKHAERLILADIMPKLLPMPHHRVLDIGCGSGLLVIPLAQMVEEVIGLDHAEVVKALGETINLPNITLIAGGFPDALVPGPFDRIVAYSVVQCSRDYQTALSFVRAAAGLLTEGGRLVIADIPNSDRTSRFRASARGQVFEAEWTRMRLAHPAPDEETAALKALGTPTVLGPLTDAQIMDLAGTLRADGFDVWIVPQSPDLPFGNTREDMIVVRL